MKRIRYIMNTIILTTVVSFETSNVCLGETSLRTDRKPYVIIHLQRILRRKLILFLLFSQLFPSIL